MPYEERRGRKVATVITRKQTLRFWVPSRLPAGRLGIPDINRATPFAIGFQTPDCDRTALCAGRSAVGSIHRDSILAEHVGKLSIRGKDNVRRCPTDVESRNLHARLNVLAQGCLADDRGQARREDDRIICPVRQDALDVAPFRSGCRPFAIPFQKPGSFPGRVLVSLVHSNVVKREGVGYADDRQKRKQLLHGHGFTLN